MSLIYECGFWLPCYSWLKHSRFAGRSAMDLLSALTERPVIRRDSKRKSGEITEDSGAASSSQSASSSEYAVGLWLSTPTAHRTDADDFMVLMTEAFWPNASGPPMPALPEQWDDVRCGSCDGYNWFWRHYCRSCGKDSLGWRHWADCGCAECVAERGRAP